MYANAYLGRVTVTRTAEGLTFTGGPDVHPMPLRLWNGKLTIINGSGDSFPLQFEGYDGGRFTKLDFPALEYIGWNELSRIP